MYSYNPFPKTIDALCSSDLAKLREVQEGWYVEYKRQFPDIASAAKSLSAFANTFGGWLFYGIEENSQTRTAGAFPGIDRKLIPQVEEWLRQAASASVTPTPFFEHKIVYGPDSEIGLLENRAVVVIYVPQGNNTPYLHLSGRIYRRVGEASDPIPEKDRHSLDLLLQRGQNRRAEFANFISQERKLSDMEMSASYITLFFFADPWGSRGLRSKIDFERFAHLMTDASPESGWIPFDNIFTASDGFVARQVKNNDPYRRVFTWKYYRNCISEVTIPLNSVEIASNVDARRFMDGYEQAPRFFELCAAHKLTNGRLLDLSQSYSILSSIMMRLSRIYEIEGLTWPVFVKARITGTWRAVPFLDISDFTAFIDAHGIPLVQEQECYAPFGTDPDSCLEISERKFGENIEDVVQRSMIARSVDACMILFEIAKALGLHYSAVGYSPSRNEDEDDWTTKLSSMGERAIEVSKRRARMQRT